MVNRCQQFTTQIIIKIHKSSEIIIKNHKNHPNHQKSQNFQRSVSWWLRSPLVPLARWMLRPPSTLFVKGSSTLPWNNWIETGHGRAESPVIHFHFRDEKRGCNIYNYNYIYILCDMGYYIYIIYIYIYIYNIILYIYILNYGRIILWNLNYQWMSIQCVAPVHLKHPPETWFSKEITRIWNHLMGA